MISSKSRSRSWTEETQVDLYGGEHYEGDGEVFQVSLNHGFRLGGGGFLNLSADYRDRGWTNRAGTDPRTGPMWCAKRAGDRMLAAGTDGLIVNISSWAGRQVSMVSGPAYSAAKHAMNAMNEVSARGLSRSVTTSAGSIRKGVRKVRK